MKLIPRGRVTERVAQILLLTSLVGVPTWVALCGAPRSHPRPVAEPRTDARLDQVHVAAVRWKGRPAVAAASRAEPPRPGAGTALGGADREAQEPARRGSLRGTLSGPDGVPIAEARILAVRWSPERNGCRPAARTPLRTTTDASGLFEYAELEPGPWTLAHVGGESSSDPSQRASPAVVERVEIAPGASGWVALIAPTAGEGAELVGRIVDPRGDPVGTLPLVVRCDGLAVARSQSASDGRFRIANLPRDAATLELDARARFVPADGRPRRVETAFDPVPLDLGGGHLDLGDLAVVLPGTFELGGRVLAPPGPFDVHLHVEYRALEGASTPARPQPLHLDPEGRFRFRAEAGPGQVRVVATSASGRSVTAWHDREGADPYAVMNLELRFVP